MVDLRYIDLRTCGREVGVLVCVEVGLGRLNLCFFSLLVF